MRLPLDAKPVRANHRCVYISNRIVHTHGKRVLLSPYTCLVFFLFLAMVKPLILDASQKAQIEESFVLPRRVKLMLTSDLLISTQKLLQREVNLLSPKFDIPLILTLLGKKKRVYVHHLLLDDLK
jgi:hypothetical protein